MPHTEEKKREMIDALIEKGQKDGSVKESEFNELVTNLDLEEGQKQLIYCFPLESVTDFETLYTGAIGWLTK